jgi:hypothetical protein
MNMLLPECIEACYVVGIVPVVLVGLAFCLYCGIIWCVIPEVIPNKVIGTGLGIAYVFYNIGSTLSPIIGSWIHDLTLNYKHGFYWVSLLVQLTFETNRNETSLLT